MFNPAVLWLELWIRVRERKVWIISLIFLACMSAMAFVTLISMGQAYSYIEPANIGTGLMKADQIFLMILLMVMGPLAAAGRITQEREQRTLPSLLNTPLSRFDIVMGKLIGSWIFVIWLAVLSFPFFALAFAWGGCSWKEFGFNISWTLAAALTVTCIGLGFSGYFQRSLNSFLATGGFLFFWCVAWPMIGGVVNMTCRPGAAASEHSRKMFDGIVNFVFFEHHPIRIQIMPSATNGGHLWAPVVVWPLIAVFFTCLAIRGLYKPASR